MVVTWKFFLAFVFDLTLLAPLSMVTHTHARTRMLFPEVLHDCPLCACLFTLASIQALLIRMILCLHVSVTHNYIQPLGMKEQFHGMLIPRSISSISTC
jgi:hypothetical protein